MLLFVSLPLHVVIAVLIANSINSSDTYWYLYGYEYYDSCYSDYDYRVTMMILFIHPCLNGIGSGNLKGLLQGKLVMGSSLTLHHAVCLACVRHQSGYVNE